MNINISKINYGGGTGGGSSSGGENIFDSLRGYTTEDIKNLNTSVVKDIAYTNSLYDEGRDYFNGYSKLRYAPKIENMTNTANRFNKCTSLIYIPKYDFSKVTTFCYLLSECGSLIEVDVSGWNSSNVKDISYMFYKCISLTDITGIDNLNVSKVTNMNNAFSYCEKLSTLSLTSWDTSNVTTMKYIFNSCKSLTSLNLSGWNVKKVTDMSNIFNSSYYLETINMSGWDMSNVTNTSGMFNYISFWKLKNLILENSILPKKNLTDWNLSGQTNLTIESLVGLLNALPDLTADGSSFTVSIGATNTSKLSDEQKAIATNKGWILS